MRSFVGRRGDVKAHVPDEGEENLSDPVFTRYASCSTMWNVTFSSPTAVIEAFRASSREVTEPRKNMGEHGGG